MPDAPSPTPTRHPGGGRLLVTGLSGFVGRTLASMVAASGGTQRWTLCELHEGFDLLKRDTVRAAVGAAAPDAVIHLAGRSNVAESFRDPETALRVNVLGTLHLLESLREAGFRGRMVYAGSGDIYGAVDPAQLPIEESMLPVPRNPYAVSKLAAEALCRQWSISEGVPVLLARAFNHIGPGQDPSFAIAGFARQLARIRLGHAPPVIEAGDLEVTRDFTDVRDVVQAYFNLLAQGHPGTPYNVCSGRETRLRDALDELAALAGVAVEVRVDPARLRPVEQRRMCGSPARLRADTGWKPSYTLSESLRALLDHWTLKEGQG